MQGKIRITTGISQLDQILEGLYIGDNVVWHDEAGNLASIFCLNFIQASQDQNKYLVYVSFDRSPKNLIEKLGFLAQNPNLIILDCFSYGIGKGSEIFMKFYEDRTNNFPCQVIKVSNPKDMNIVMDTFYKIYDTLKGDIRFIFESLTGMQKVWGKEEDIINFYSQSCPRLYEMNTIAYWILEKKAHSTQFKAKINQIAQVAIDVMVKKGTNFLTVLKAESRNPDKISTPLPYTNKDLNIIFDSEKKASITCELGERLRQFRTKCGLSQSELANLVGLKASIISQVERNVIYPSLPSLLKIAEVLSVDIASFFQEKPQFGNRILFPAAEAVEIKFNDLPEKTIYAKKLTPVDIDSKSDPYIIEILPNKTLPSHFFIHKGEELGYLLSGNLQFKLQKAVYTAKTGDIILLSTELPTQWKNPGPGIAKLFWLKIS